MGLKPRAFLAGSLGFAVAFVVACGGGGNGLLSGQQADNLNAQLNSVSAAVSAHHCGGASGAVRAFANQVAALPSTVNSTLSRNLSQGADTLSQLAQRDCTTSSSSSSSSSTTSSTTSSSTSSISTTTVTNSTPPSSSSTNTGTATNPGGTGTSSTSSNGGAGIGGTPGANG